MQSQEDRASWNKAIPIGGYRLVEAWLYRYAEAKKDVADYEEQILYRSPKPSDGQPKGNSVSNPTELAGMKLADAPGYIEERKQWIDAIDYAVKLCDESDASKGTYYGELIRDYYWLWDVTYQARNSTAVLKRIAEKHYVSLPTVRRVKDSVVAIVWSVALWKGLVEPEL